MTFTKTAMLCLLYFSGFGISGEINSYLTFDNQPLGSVEKPLVMRTFLPNLELDSEVLANHAVGLETPQYSSRTGVLSAINQDQPIPGIPAGIAVNTGMSLSYVWDTTECRLLYAWNGGFLDMESYWGTPDRGSRKKYDYVPRLIGQLFYRAKGSHPLKINGKPIGELKYTGHRRERGLPVFQFLADGHAIETKVTAGKDSQTLEILYQCNDSKTSLGFEAVNTAFEVSNLERGDIKVLIRPNAAGSYSGFEKEVIKIVNANAGAGEKLYTSYGCSACHTIDGGRNHGPTFKGLAGAMRKFEDGSTTKATSEYLIESIKTPNARHVTGYPAGMMPAYPLGEKEVESLVLYIQNLK